MKMTENERKDLEDYRENPIAKILARASQNFAEKFAGEVGKTLVTDSFYDLSMCELVGEDCVRHYVDDMFTEHIGDKEYVAELCLSVAWRGDSCWERDPKMSEVYYDLFNEYRGRAYDHYKDDEAAKSFLWSYWD